MEHSTKNNYEIIYKNTFWVDMSKMDKLKVVKIVRSNSSVMIISTGAVAHQ